jgi:hypothetical protein
MSVQERKRADTQRAGDLGAVVCAKALVLGNGAFPVGQALLARGAAAAAARGIFFAARVGADLVFELRAAPVMLRDPVVVDHQWIPGTTKQSDNLFGPFQKVEGL